MTAVVMRPFVWDIVTLPRFQKVEILLDSKTVWEVLDVDADYKAASMGGLVVDIHTYHRLHIGAGGMTLTMASQGEANAGHGRYSLYHVQGELDLENNLYEPVHEITYPTPDAMDIARGPENLGEDPTDLDRFLYYMGLRETGITNGLIARWNRYRNHLVSLRDGEVESGIDDVSGQNGTVYHMRVIQEEVMPRLHPLVSEIEFLWENIMYSRRLIRGVIQTYYDLDQVTAAIADGTITIGLDGAPTIVAAT